MNALRYLLTAGVVVSMFACSTVCAQDDEPDGVAISTGLPLDNVSGGALQQRAPGRWVDQAVNRSIEITQPDPSGPDLWPILREAVITAFLEGIQDALDTLIGLLNVASLFDDLGLTDASREVGPPQSAMAIPSPDASSVRRPLAHFT